jgi:hypothetical protein
VDGLPAKHLVDGYHDDYDARRNDYDGRRIYHDDRRFHEYHHG